MRKELMRPSNPTGVHGGDFEGIIEKLDYIKALGATAIWISPIVLNTEGQFHGYSAWNFYEVAPHWGSITNLQNDGAGRARTRLEGY